MNLVHYEDGRKSPIGHGSTESAEAAYHRCLCWRVTRGVIKTEAVSGALSGLL